MYTAWNTSISIIFNVPRDTHRYLIESISQSLHLKAMLVSRCVFFYETIEAISKLCIRFLYAKCKKQNAIYAKMTVTQFFADIYFLLQMIVY